MEVCIVFSKASEFLANVKSEVKKVTWPSRKDTYSSTIVVIVLVLIVAVFLWLCDVVLQTGIHAILTR
jgi:preprotein translocase subunit SecE